MLVSCIHLASFLGASATCVTATQVRARHILTRLATLSIISLKTYATYFCHVLLITSYYYHCYYHYYYHYHYFYYHFYHYQNYHY